MFQFPGFAFVPYVFRNKYLLVIPASPKARLSDAPRISVDRRQREIFSHAVRTRKELLE